MGEVIQSVEQDTTHGFGFLDKLFIVIWRGRIEPHIVQGLIRHMETFSRTQPQFAIVTVVEPGAPLPDAPVRKELASVFQRFSSVLVASAVVHEGTGFAAVAVRSIATGISLLARQPFPHKVFSTVDDAAAWISTLPVGPAAGALPADVVRRGVAQLRQ